MIIFLGLILAIPAYSKTFVYEKGMNFGSMDHLLRKQALQKTDQVLNQAAASYNENCHKLKKNFYSTYNGTFSCKFNVRKFAEGQKQFLLKGRLTRLPTSNINGFKVRLKKPINYSATIETKQYLYQLDVLDYKRPIWTNEKKHLFRNIYIKYAPYNHTVWANVCSELPGIAINTQLSKIYVRAEKKIFWFLKAKADIEIDASLGSYWNRSARVCGGAKVGYDKNKALNSLSQWTVSQSILQPKFYLQKPQISPIKFDGVKVKKVRVKGRNLFTKIVFFLFKKIKT